MNQAISSSFTPSCYCRVIAGSDNLLNFHPCAFGSDERNTGHRRTNWIAISLNVCVADLKYLEGSILRRNGTWHRFADVKSSILNESKNALAVYQRVLSRLWIYIVTYEIVVEVFRISHKISV